MTDEQRYIPIEDDGRTAELAMAWVIVFFTLFAAVFLGIVAWNSWGVARESQAIFARLDLSGRQACGLTPDAGPNTARAASHSRLVALKPGWKIFNQDPVRFQYPEDYRVTTPIPGRIQVEGKGGRLDIQTAYEVGQVDRLSGRSGADKTAQNPANESIDLQYGVDIHAEFFYAPDAESYDRGVLKDIASTISLNR